MSEVDDFFARQSCHDLRRKSDDRLTHCACGEALLYSDIEASKYGAIARRNRSGERCCEQCWRELFEPMNGIYQFRVLP